MNSCKPRIAQAERCIPKTSAKANAHTQITQVGSMCGLRSQMRWANGEVPRRHYRPQKFKKHTHHIGNLSSSDMACYVKSWSYRRKSSIGPRSTLKIIQWSSKLWPSTVGLVEKYHSGPGCCRRILLLGSAARWQPSAFVCFSVSCYRWIRESLHRFLTSTFLTCGPG
jgi:hypothetical protein